jgi:hypothetical protein
MPNVCVLAFANGEIGTIETDEWPEIDDIREAVGGRFTEVPTPFQMEFDKSWGEEAGTQETVVYCNEDAALKGAPVNLTTIARAINNSLSEPLLGDILVVSGSPEFLALQD